MFGMLVAAGRCLLQLDDHACYNKCALALPPVGVLSHHQVLVTGPATV